MRKFLAVIICFVLVGCGFKLASNNANYPDVTFINNKLLFQHDISKKRIYRGIIANAKDSKIEDDYFCEITDISISNSRIATNASGEDSSYKLYVRINYKLFDKNQQMIDENSYDVMELYQLDNSLYSAEVKNDQILDTVPKAFLNHIYQKLLLRPNLQSNITSP